MNPPEPTVMMEDKSLAINRNSAPWLMRVVRATRYFPRFRGTTLLRGIYRQFISSDTRFRINDFDKDIRLDLNVAETIGVNLWHAPRRYEKLERDLFCSAIHPGAVVLDIGANIGIYTLLAAKRGAQVYAIEADTDNLRALGHHVELNGFSDRVTVLNVAAIDCERPVTLYRNPTNSGGSTIFGDGNGTMVRGCTVDSFDLPPLDVCKIDIEGAELLALRGMKNVLTRSPRLKLLIEYSQQSGRCEELLAFLHREFTSICVVGGSQIFPSMRPPAFCNLWACRG